MPSDIGTRRTACSAELLRILGYFLPHLGIYQAFENRMALESLAGSGLALPPIRDYYERIVDYGLDTAWGRRAPMTRHATRLVTGHAVVINTATELTSLGIHPSFEPMRTTLAPGAHRRARGRAFTSCPG